MNLLDPKHAYIHPFNVPSGQPTNAGWWADIANSPKCREAMQVALSKMVLDQRHPTVQDAANNAYRMDGARQFVTILLNLGEPDIPSGLPQTKQLIPT